MILVQALWNTNDQNGVLSFFKVCEYRGLNHLGTHCILTIEAWLNLNINFDRRYLEL